MGPIELIRGFNENFMPQTRNLLAIFNHERDIRSHFKNCRHTIVGRTVFVINFSPETRIKETGVVRAQLTHGWIECNHLSSHILGDNNAFA